MLYQMAAAFVFAKTLNVTCIIAWWDQRDPNLRKPLYLPYEGRSGPAPGITLKHIFPRIHYVDFQPSTRHVTVGSHCHYIPGQARAMYLPIPQSLRDQRALWIRGAFFRHECSFVCP
jgi:hypothetical protein